MTTTVLLIRHGQTNWNEARRWQGHVDIALNDKGRDQARALAQRLATWPIKAIYSSDLSRAAHTADILAKSLGLVPVYDTGLRERSGGKFEGLTADELHRDFPRFLQRLRDEGAAPPDGESRLEVTTRIVNAFKLIVERHPAEMVALVSHGGSLSALIANILGLPANQRPRISIGGNTGLSIVEIGEDGPFLTLLNDTGHLVNLSVNGAQID